ncbi:MAG TPA: hypothetical protein VFY65_12540 [Longimicrobium sp.]|nr:hypothetical protein [Longimicrobium sp.]
MITQPGGGLHVDRVLADPLGVPQGLDHALRRMERGARQQRDLLAALAARPDAAGPVHAAAQELERFLEDGDRSPLLRALRRPLRQIAPGTAGWQNLHRAWEGLRSRAEGATRLQAALDGIRAEVARIRERFGDELPCATREVLRRERLEEHDVARIARAEDARPLHARLRRAEHELERLWERVDDTADDQLQRGTSWAEEAAPGEVLALLQLRLRERARRLHERDAVGTLRLLAARQVRALGQAAAWRRPAGTPAHAFAQRMGELLLRGPSHVRGGEDLALWGELLGAAADTLYDPARSTGWAAQLPDVPLPEARETGLTRFVTPIDETYALISPGHPSPVRVTDKRVALDSVVECTVFLDDDEAETLPMAGLDVEPLFEGLEAEPAWYATARRAKLQVIARVGDEWIARVARRGALRRTRRAAWDAARPDDARLRVLGTLSAPAPPTGWEVGAGDGVERTFCGVSTVPVTMPLVESPAGWMRVAAGTGWAAEAVQAEEACFRALARKVPLTVPLWAGRGTLSGRRLQGPLYVPPFGLRAAELPPLDAWLRSESEKPLLAAVARLWLRVTESGYGLGIYHVDALAFTVGGADPGGNPAAHALLTDAPFAVPLGQYHPRPPMQDALFPFYPGIGAQVLPPAAASGDVALPASEAQAFALFALDALARKPLPLSGVVPCETLAEIVPELAANFVYPETATRLSAALGPGAKTDGVASFIRRLAAL